MKSKGRSYRRLFIIFLVFLLVCGLAYRYFPFSKILRVKAGKALSQIEPAPTGSEPPNSIAFDFEVARGKEVPNGIVSGMAHSGQYAAKAFGKNSFTPALERLAGDLGTSTLGYISISAWIYVKPGGDPVSAVLVLAASNAVGVNICWKGTSLKDPGVPRGKWFKMNGQFDLRDVKFSKDTRVQMYFWNNSSTDIYVDDYYLVYGGPAPRKGDTTYVDLTKGPYTAKFNYPPFPVVCMRMEDIGGMGATSLATVTEGVQESVVPYYPMISGSFIPGNPGRDELFVMPAGGPPVIYAYCAESNEFIKSRLEMPVPMPYSKGRQYLLKGRFSGGDAEQLLFIGEKSCFLYRFSSKGGICSSKSVTGAELLWQNVKFDNQDFHPNRRLLAEDFDGDGISEILEYNETGAWKMFRFQLKGKTGDWNLIAESHELQAGWNGPSDAVTLTAGHFIPGRILAGILAISRDEKTRKCTYTLSYYNTPAKTFASFFSPKTRLFGKTIGIDTLKPDDHFFCGNFGINAAPMLLRYNRDWRFDLKEIRFSDSTYHILNNLDFEGYTADHNPKYYEVLKLIPGRFTGNQASFIVIGRNCRNKDFNGMDCEEYESLAELPDFISVYSFVRP